MKVIYLQAVSGDEIVKKGEERDLDAPKAWKLHKAGIVEIVDKKSIKKLADEEAKRAEEARKKEEEVQAALYREELEAERLQLESRLTEIHNILESGKKEEEK